MIFDLHHTTKLDGSINCRLFVDGRKCGDLVFTAEQFETFVRRFAFIELTHDREEKSDG